MDSLIKSLETVLADTYSLFLKTQNYHWNVEGCCFKENHEMFENQYKDLFEAMDECAELIRGLGSKVNGTFVAFSKNTQIKDGDGSKSSNEMIMDLANDQIAIEKSLKTAFKEAQAVEDEVITGFLATRMTIHRKNAWMLNSSVCKKK